MSLAGTLEVSHLLPTFIVNPPPRYPVCSPIKLLPRFPFRAMPGVLPFVPGVPTQVNAKPNLGTAVNESKRHSSRRQWLLVVGKKRLVKADF